jgi:hypothetical protein
LQKVWIVYVFLSATEKGIWSSVNCLKGVRRKHKMPVPNTLCQQTLRHFEFLVTEYHFVLGEKMCEPVAGGDGLVEYRSNSLFVLVTSDRGQISVDLGPYPKLANLRFELGTVMWYLVGDRSLSQGLTDQSYTQLPDPPESMPRETYVELQLASLVSSLRQYCRSILEGGDTDWSDMERTRRLAVAAFYKRKTGLDYPDDAS